MDLLLSCTFSVDAGQWMVDVHVLTRSLADLIQRTSSSCLSKYKSVFHWFKGSWLLGRDGIIAWKDRRKYRLEATKPITTIPDKMEGLAEEQGGFIRLRNPLFCDLRV